MRDCLQSGQDLVLGGVEGVDEDVSVFCFRGLVKDGGCGEASGGQEGEVCGCGAGTGYDGRFGFEVKADEAILEAPTRLMSGAVKTVKRN